MELVLVIDNLELHGAQRFTVQTAERFVQNGVEVNILCYDAGPLLGNILALGIDYSIEESRYRLFNALRKLVRRKKVVFSSLSSGLVVSILKIFRFKFWHIHRVCNTVSFEAKQYPWAQRILYFFKLVFVARFSDVMVFQSENMYVDWIEATKFKPKNAFILANPIKIDGNSFARRIRPDVCRCISVGIHHKTNYSPRILPLSSQGQIDSSVICNAY